MKIKYFCLTGFLAILLIFSIPVVQKLLGYYPGLPGWEMAQIAVEKKNVKLCDRITALPWAIFVLGPPTAERRISCVHRYASLAKDPTACELLMPSSYGLSCVGGAESESDICSMGNGKVSWNNGEETYASCANTTKKRSQDADACCLIARVSFVLTENDCSPLKQYPDMYDECLQNLAFKNHDPATCNSIANDNTKSACIVNASAIRKNPSICSGCKTRVQTLKELK